MKSRGRFLEVKIDIKWLRIAAWLHDGCRRPLEDRLKGSWKHLGALLAALGVLLECPQGRESAQGELGERSGNGPGRDKGRVNLP